MSNRLVSVACHHCGAPLSIPDDLRFVTCAHCGTSLSVEHSGDAYFTRELQELAETTQRIDEKVDAIHAAIVGRGHDSQDDDVFGDSSMIHQHARMISNAQRVVMLLMSLIFAFVFFLIASRFHPLFGIVFGAVPLLGGVTAFIGSGALNSRLLREQSDSVLDDD